LTAANGSTSDSIGPGLHEIDELGDGGVEVVELGLQFVGVGLGGLERAERLDLVAHHRL
jgi:hypothetical protein